MREFSIEKDLKRILNKIIKKDIVLYSAVMNKMDEILNCADVNHYKNLKSPLQNFKRVHVKGSFVLTFKYDLSEDKVLFYALDHHDKIYK
jgi:YafQ family addiction module toxin component